MSLWDIDVQVVPEGHISKVKGERDLNFDSFKEKAW